MKKVINVLSIVIITISFLIISNDKVQATSPAEGTWNTGTEITNNSAQTTALNDEISLFGNEVQVTKKVEICHPFRGGQFGWTAEIRRLVNGNWVKLATTMRNLPTEEGVLNACATAPAAGTYALFGYYNGPLEISVPATAPVCTLSMDGWTNETLGDTLYLFIDNLDEGTMIHFKQTSTDPNVTLTTAEGDVPVKIAKYRVAELTDVSQTGEWEVNIEVSVQGCSKVFTFNGGAD